MKWMPLQPSRVQRRREDFPVKTKRAGFLTKLVVLSLLVAAATALLNMKSELASVQSDKDALIEQRNGLLQVTADLRDAVDHSDDPERQIDMARNQLDLTEPGDQVIIFTD